MSEVGVDVSGIDVGLVGGGSVWSGWCVFKSRNKDSLVNPGGSGKLRRDRRVGGRGGGMLGGVGGTGVWGKSCGGG